MRLSVRPRAGRSFFTADGLAPKTTPINPHIHRLEAGGGRTLALTVGVWRLWLPLRGFAGSGFLLPLRFLLLLPLLSDRAKGGLNVPLLCGVLRRYGLP